MERDAKKKLADAVSAAGRVIDPLEGFECKAEVYDVQRKATLYFDSEGKRCWTKAWFNGREKGRASRGGEPCPRDLVHQQHLHP